jgi:N-sulfoglucosamine sulfohydrolase
VTSWEKLLTARPLFHIGKNQMEKILLMAPAKKSGKLRTSYRGIDHWENGELANYQIEIGVPETYDLELTHAQTEKEHISINLVIQGQKITKDLAPGVGTNLGKVHLNKGDALLELSLNSGAPESNFKLFEIKFFKTTRMKRIIPLCLLLVLLTLFSCHTEEDNTRKPNILLIIAEDISPMLGCYGDAYATTPRLDDLASAGIVFTNALTTAPICAPSRSTLASGIYATSLGTQHLRSEVPFPDNLQTLPELMKEQGYFTAIRGKTDYNFSPDGLWDLWDQTYAPWRKNDTDKPFYSYMNIGPSHEGSVISQEKYLELTKDLSDELRHDPATVEVPPYFPDTGETRRIMANYYDVMTVLDQNVGMVLDSLNDDGLKDETIVIFIADHGLGLPRYKRWLYRTGMHVPMIVHAPDKYRHLIPGYREDEKNDQLISFVDIAPTILNLAGAMLPDYVQGKPMFGENASLRRKYAFGARDRADDMYEMSRSVTDGRYFYVRHFMPHYAFIQPGFIFSDRKDIFKELRRAYQNDELNQEQLKLWHPKYVEELYDWKTDRHELKNLTNDPEFAEIKAGLKRELHNWMIETKDLGLLPEAEYMIRSQHSSPYNYAHESGNFRAEQILAAAEQVGVSTETEIRKNLSHDDSGVRYWGIIGLMQFEKINGESIDKLRTLLHDASASVQIAAAEALCGFGSAPEAIETLGKQVQDDRPWVALQAARSIQLVGEQARPLIPIMYEVLDKNLGGPNATHAKYQDFNFSAFTSWSLEWALQELGEDIQVN